MHKFYHMNCFLDLGSSNRSIYNNYIFKEGAPPPYFKKKVFILLKNFMILLLLLIVHFAALATPCFMIDLLRFIVLKII